MRKVGDAQKPRHHRSVVIADDPLPFSEAENIEQEVANRAAVGCQQVEVVNAADWHPGLRALLRTIAQRRLLPSWRGDVIDVPELSFPNPAKHVDSSAGSGRAFGIADPLHDYLVFADGHFLGVVIERKSPLL